MSVEKVSLTSFRCLLFFFFAGVGCLLPFVSLHLESSGLDKEDIQLISFTAPIVASLGPSISGPLVDYLSKKRRAEVKKSNSRGDRSGYIRTVLATAVLLSAVFYCLLLSVPIVGDPNDRQEASFVCNQHGASIVQEKCEDLSCIQFSDEKVGIARLKKCKVNCDLPSHYGYIETPIGNADIDQKPVAKTTRAMTTTTRTTTTRTTTTTTTAYTIVADQSEQPVRSRIRPEIDISNLNDFFGTLPPDEDEDGDMSSGEESDIHWNHNHRKREIIDDPGLSFKEAFTERNSVYICQDKKMAATTQRNCYVFTSNSANFNITVTMKRSHEDDRHCSYPLSGNFSCRIPSELDKPNQSCKVICEVENIFSSDEDLLQSQCGQNDSDPEYIFWSYLTFRTLGDLFFSASIALVIASTIVAAGEEAGREFILPSLSYGLFATVMGYLHSDDLSPLMLDNIPNFFLGIVGFGFFCVCTLFVLIFATNLSIGPSDWWRTSRNANIRHKKEFYAVLFVLILLGMLWGPIYFHVPWHITKRGGLELYVGCAAAVGALVSVPFVWKAYKIVDYCGYSNLLIGAFTVYIMRYTGLLFIENPWVLSIIGAMEVFTLCLMLFSAVFYIRHLVPKHLTFTTQSFAIASHFCVGGGLGCLVSYFLSPTQEELKLKNSSNSTRMEIEPESGTITGEFSAPYHSLYYVGAVSAAVIAVLYFFAYHCCLKKRCLAPLYRSDQNGSLPQEAGENGLYTPLRIIHNGRQSRTEPTT